MEDETDDHVFTDPKETVVTRRGSKVYVRLHRLSRYPSWKVPQALKVQPAILVLYVLVVIALPVAMVAVGSVWLRQCPAEPFIPIYLVVMGTSLILKVLIHIVEVSIDNRQTRDPDLDEDEDERRLNIPLTVLQVAHWVFIVGWFIAGSYWVYHIHQTYTPVPTVVPSHGNMANLCQRDLYSFAFWLQTAIYIIVALCLLMACFCGIFLGFLKLIWICS